MKAYLTAFWLWIKAMWNRVLGKPVITSNPAGDFGTIEHRIELLKDVSVYWPPHGEQYRDILLEIAQLEKMEKTQAYVPGQTITRLK